MKKLLLIALVLFFASCEKDNGNSSPFNLSSYTSAQVEIDGYKPRTVEIFSFDLEKFVFRSVLPTDDLFVNWCLDQSVKNMTVYLYRKNISVPSMTIKAGQCMCVSCKEITPDVGPDCEEAVVSYKTVQLD